MSPRPASTRHGLATWLDENRGRLSLPPGKILEFAELLRRGPVSFTYRKKDGSLRHAEGTTNAHVLGNHGATPTGEGPANGYIRYFDFERNDWRQTHAGRLLDFQPFEE